MSHPNRRTCTACKRRFTCDSAFHLHIIGRRSVSSAMRCRTDEEMRTIGMGQHEDGAWTARTSPRAKAKAGTVPPGRRGPFA
jgi:hypothetical protein